MYTYLIFDADYTLINFAVDENIAFKSLFAEYGVSTDEYMLSRCREMAAVTWNEAGLNDMDSKRTQEKFHELYREHVVPLFKRIFEKYPLPISPEVAAEKFLRLLETGGAPMKGAEEVLATLSQSYKICVATNGLHDIQTGRLKEMRRYFHRVYISEDLGVIKPLSGFFSEILRDLGAKAEECLMIGDSLEADMVGSAGVGMDNCWVNQAGRVNASSVSVKYEIKTLKDLLKILKPF